MEQTDSLTTTLGLSEAYVTGGAPHNIGHRNLSAYGEFIVQRLDEDLTSYKNATRHVPGSDEQAIFRVVADRKIADLLSLSKELPEICRPSHSRLTRPAAASSTRYWLDVELNPIWSPDDAILFVYRREYRTLRLFQRFCLQAREAPVQALFDAAVWRQQETIFWLDATTPRHRSGERTAGAESSHGRQGVTWALIVA